MPGASRLTNLDETQPDGAGKGGAAEWREYGLFLLKLAALVLIVRSLIFAPFNIPSESMQPRLLIGDYLIVSKWPYGFSRYSLPFSPPLFEGRILGSYPKRGDVVVFRPPGQDVDYIKRAIGLPGDIMQMRGGVLYINGSIVQKQRIADLVIPVTRNMIDTAEQERMTGLDAHPCWKPSFEEAGPDGGRQCRFPQYRETLPGGKSFAVLDVQGNGPGDDTEPLVVPDGHVFFMGDNRDRSADSRFPPDGVAIGMVPIENVIGRAEFVVFSTDGSARWILPWTWVSAARWNRIGEGI